MSNKENINRELFEKQPVRKAFITLAVPTVLSQVIIIVYSLADSFFVGRLGDPNQVAALAISFPVFNMLTALANVFGIGAASVISRSLGSHNGERAAKASSCAFWGAVLSSGLMVLILVCFMKDILFLLGAGEDTYTYTREYLIWVVLFGGLPAELSLLLGHLLRSEGRTKSASLGMTLGGVLNIVLDPLFIFCFHLGVSGAGMATMLANTASMLFLFFIFTRIRFHTALSLDPRKFTLGEGILLSIVSVGLPSGLNTFLVNLDNALMSGLTSAYSNQAIAAYGITQKITTATIHISQGMAQGILPLIGYNYSQGSLSRVRETNRFALRTLFIFTIAFFAAIELSAPALARVFIDQASTARVTAVFMRCWMLCSFGMCLFQMYNAIFQAVGLWKQALLLTVCRLGIFFPAAALGADALFSLRGLMFSQPLSDTLTLLLCMLAYRRMNSRLLSDTGPAKLRQ
ncbi:MATE family efflux transporter [Anaerovorax odorimutans]|uniref:MATE family efflux transporter n=1 Tax=Anaerovorax odorimutans TaxID=109327 RepID=A0ABT1RKL9_9FIRM|nr:MATE family efflux transporter [Anaerovorax odorimutans]MCQ4635715.1 MATE family efflux transporter [Anaerovorax odorimutans]